MIELWDCSGTGNLFENWGGRGEKWMQSRAGDWYFILPNGELYLWDQSAFALGTLVARLETAFHTDPNLLFDAAEIAADRRYGFMSNGNLFFNWGGLGDKWFQAADNSWYFILPGGAVFEWNESATATGRLALTTHPRVYNDPSLLFEVFDLVFQEWTMI